MRLLDSRVYWWVSRLSSYLLLSGLWLLCSSPVLTFFPATVAMFAVFRAWQDNPDEAFYLPFLARLRGYFVSDFVLGLLWLLLAALLLLNAMLLPQVPSPVRPPAFGLLALGGLLYLAASIFIFPLQVRTSLGLRANARAAVVLGMTQLGTTVLCTLVLTLAGTAFWYFPPSLFLSGAAAGHLVYGLCSRRLGHFFT